MHDWTIFTEGYSENEIAANGNRFLCGNGYLGIRGTLEEYGKKELTAVNLAGIYDQAGDGWREPLNAPNPFYTRLKVDGVLYALPQMDADYHKQTVDYRKGIVTRQTVFECEKGKIEIFSERFAHRNIHHVIGMQYCVRTDFDAVIEVETGIDCDIWEINGPHYDEMFTQAEQGILQTRAVTHEKKDVVAVMEKCWLSEGAVQDYKNEDHKSLRNISAKTDSHTSFVMTKLAVIYTSNDGEDPVQLAEKELKKATEAGYENLKHQHIEGWEALWEMSAVEIDGDSEAEKSLNYSLYHLLSIAPYHTDSLSIAARGLSGQTYKGAVFWDTEMFMLDFFLNCQPEVAKRLLNYRIDTLCGAKEKAKQYGYEGAFYAWESQEGGFDACSDYNVTDVFSGRPMRTYFRDKQIHISGAIVYGLMKYIKMTGDSEILYRGGAEVVIECAKFYDSLLIQKAHSDVYELRDVIGPDEYHERINNNGYTNRMAKYVFEQAVLLLKKSSECSDMEEALAGQPIMQLMARFEEDAKKIYIPVPMEDGVVEQFDGYRKLEDTTIEEVRGRILHEKEYWGGAYGVASETQIIKQADVVTWMVMFPEDFTEEQKWKNWCYYEPRTEHGSSLSACMYSILACECGKQDEAYPFFKKSAEADRRGGGKEWAGEIYIGGTHPAAAGGAYMTAVYGFAGVKVKDGKLTAEPKLPAGWNGLKFHMYYQNELFEISVTNEQADIKLQKN